MQHRPLLYTLYLYTLYCSPLYCAAVDDDEAYDEEDEDAAERKRQAKEDARRNRQLQRAMKVLDPETIAAHHLLPADQARA